MRDSPLSLNVAWGKARDELMSLWQPRKKNDVYYPQKKEKPRGSGAFPGEKE